MKNLFRFDVRLKDLMNFEEQAKNFSKLNLLFKLLDYFWYDVGDKSNQEHRRNNIRIGSVEVFLDDDGALHLDFCTRFSFNNEPAANELLHKISK